MGPAMRSLRGSLPLPQRTAPNNFPAHWQGVSFLPRRALDLPGRKVSDMIFLTKKCDTLTDFFPSLAGVSAEGVDLLIVILRVPTIQQSHWKEFIIQQM